MQTKEKDGLLFIRLFPKEDVYNSLDKALMKHNVLTGVLLSGLGQLAEFELGFFKEKGNYVPEKFDSPFELCSLTGNVSLQHGKYEFHLHAVLSNEKKETVGGHLLSGVVSVTAEIVVLKTDLTVIRKIEEETGLNSLFLE